MLFCPGAIQTNMSEQWDQEYRQRLISTIPLPKIEARQDVANAVW